jgi:para-nitrobenzyl esterase
MTKVLLKNGYRGVCCLALMACIVIACTEDKTSKEADDDAQTGDAAEQTGETGATKVTLSDGKLEGDVVGGAVRFLKIPYAKPPMGELRWKAPQPNEPWNGVRHETDFSSHCPQAKSELGEASTDEDCLYLNVWRPNKNNSESPVMVWIHGGGLTTGSASDLVPTADQLWFDGQFFAERHGVVVVTFNYRLGALGFFAHPALADEGSPVGNQGLLDQQRVLHWVHDNIEAFGGDPKNVTIFGESAGSGSVCMHVASPGSRGLFHRAISESGGCTTNSATDRDTLNAQLEKFASDHGCEGDDVLKCLREKPVDQIISMQEIVRTGGLDALKANMNFGPVVDGKDGVLPEPAGDLYDRGDVAQVPYLLGTNTEEANVYFLNAPVPETDADFESAIRDKYGDFADRVLALYPLSKFGGDIRKTMSRIASDSGLVCSTHDTARRAAKAGLSVFMYNFNIPWSVADGHLGPCHASELSHVFGDPYVFPGQDPDVTSKSKTVSDAMNAYWAQFAATGNPNYKDAPAVWPDFVPDKNDNDKRLQLDANFDILDSFRKEECQLWREYGQSDI